jgi:acyl-CoA reductase-like NAD-dependent aldehyde dehydrogenase
MVEKTLSELARQIALRSHYDNWIGGKWVPAVKGQTFENPSPVTGRTVSVHARSAAEDIELTLDAAHAARVSWARTSPAERSRVLNKIADRLEEKPSLLAPALAAGNCVVLKPAEQTPLTVLVFMEVIADLLPPGVVNVVAGFGVAAGKPLAQSKRIAKIAFTGETTPGRLIKQYASENLIPVTLELGGKSLNTFR